MSLANLQRSSSRNGVEQFGDAGPVAATLDTDGLCTVVLGNAFAKRGQRLKPILSRASGTTIEAIRDGAPASEGKKAVARTGPGDLVVFRAAYVEGDTLVGDRIVSRIHDGMKGRVQIAYALARPTRTSVSKRGISQRMNIIDPSSAAKVSKREEMLALVREVYARAWPGGDPIFMFRDGARTEDVEIENDGKKRETPEEFVARMVDVNKLLSKGPIEIIPKWTLPMGREQVMREGLDPKIDAKGVDGKFTSLWPANARERGYVPTLLILGDEEEWAFGQGTGKTQRTVLGAHPMNTTRPAFPNDVATAVRRTKDAVPFGVNLLVKSDSDLDAAAKAREFRNPKPSVTPSRPAAEDQPAARGPAPFPGMLRRMGVPSASVPLALAANGGSPSATRTSIETVPSNSAPIASTPRPGPVRFRPMPIQPPASEPESDAPAP